MDNTNTRIVEQLLLNKLIDGDKGAFTTIFEAYYKDLVMFAFTFFKNREDAEEIVQDMFVHLWEKHGEVKVTGSLKSYLLKAVQNRCLDQIRHRKVCEQYASGIEAQQLYANDTEEYILYTDLQNRLETILSLMPDEVSLTFRMNRFDGLKYQEIAQQLNVSLRTVESRISKALQILHRLV